MILLKSGTLRRIRILNTFLRGDFNCLAAQLFNNDYNKQELKAFEQKIEKLIARRKELNQLNRKRLLTEDDEEELAAIPGTLEELKENKKFWQELVKISAKKEAKLEEENFAFGDVSDEVINNNKGTKFYNWCKIE